MQSYPVAVLTYLLSAAKLCSMVGAGNEMGTSGGGVENLPILPTEIFFPHPNGERWFGTISDLRVEGPLNAEELIQENPTYEGLKSERYDLPYGATYESDEVPLLAGGIYEYSYTLIDPYISMYGGEKIALIGFLDGPASVEAGPVVEVIEDLTKKLSPEDNYIGARVRLLKVDVVPDWNRDGVIDSSDRGQVTDSNPFRFWFNNDNDINEASGEDAPLASSPDWTSINVDTSRDLVDFFPVFIDLKDFLGTIDDLSTITVKLKHAQGGLNCVYTDLLPEDSGTYLRQADLTTGFGSNFNKAPGEANTIAINSNGHELSEAFLAKIRDEDKGILLFEGAKTNSGTLTDPLVLEVSNSSGVLFEYEMPLSLSQVNEMYHHVDLTGTSTEYDGSALSPIGSAESTNTSASNWPDEMTNGKNLAFVHGFRVDGSDARGWNAEAFKRMHQIGSNARFIGVSWNGVAGFGRGDYHKAVFQAFQTGEVLANNLNPTGDLTVLAHSLGNIVVGHAIQDWNFRPDRYFMVNPAVAIEAYDDVGIENDMVEDDWRNLISINQERLYPSNWHMLFSGTSDNRRHLKWREIFINALTDTELYNFYSPQDEVFDQKNGIHQAESLGLILDQGFDFARGSWKFQELIKGKGWFWSGDVSAVLFERKQAGWNRDGYWFTDPEDIPAADLKTDPYFELFLEGDLTDDDVSVASAKAGEDEVRYDVLGRGIPALSYAAGQGAIPALGSANFDMDLNGRVAGQWPTDGHTGDNSGQWLHNDFINVALPYMHLVYQEMVNLGGLDEAQNN